MGTILVNGLNPRDRQNRPLILKNNAPFISGITGINNELIEDADDLDIVMPMHNLLEYSKNHRKTIASLYNYYRDELNNDANLANFANNNVVSSEAFKYKTKVIGNTYDVDSTIPNPAGAGRIFNPNYNLNNSGKKKCRISHSIKIFR